MINDINFSFTNEKGELVGRVMLVLSDIAGVILSIPNQKVTVIHKGRSEAASVACDSLERAEQVYDELTKAVSRYNNSPKN